jgi:ribosomal protein S18 acetylase RimI-like enzyme
VTRLRPYRNGDSPALADLWNRALTGPNAVRPLNVHEFDLLVLSKPTFDRRGLIVAERDGRLVAYAHAGFGPPDPPGAAGVLDTGLGTLAMLVAEPGLGDAAVVRGLVLEAERYLRARGAEVLYAGGQYPLNPFYWGLYGGSEFAGILESHRDFSLAAQALGYEPVATTALLEADVSGPEPRDPRLVALRRQFRVEVEEDAVLPSWWDALAIGLFHPTRFSLVDKQDGGTLASAWTWDIASGFAIGDGRSRTGLIRVEVAPTHRNQGLGKLLVAECLKHARAQLSDVLCAQTATTNEPALSLYESLGFDPVETATLFRLPAHLADRSRA